MSKIISDIVTNSVKIENVIKITETEELRDIILSGQFDDSIQVKNTEHICQDGTIYDYSEITDLSGMFLDCSSLTTIPLFDTSNIIRMDGMFHSCSSLISIPMFDISNVTHMSFMFSRCSSLTSIPLFDLSNLTNIIDVKTMFYNCFNLTKIPFSDIKKLTNVESAFYGCSSLLDTELIKFFYQKDKLLLKSLELNPKLFSEDKLKELLSEEKLNKLLEKY
jgi:surface protein